MKIKDVAKLANVSMSTVSKIINNKADNINPETIQRVLKIVKEYNYEPYSDIKNRNTSKKFIIAIIIKNKEFNHSIFQGILDQADTKKYLLLFLNSNNSLEQELKNITNICQNKYDGVIWDPISDESLINAKYFEEKEISVFITSWLKIPNNYSINFKDLGFKATEYLIGNEHRKIGFLVDNKDPDKFKSIIDGFKQSIFKNKMQFSDDLIFDFNDPSLLETLHFRKITALIAPTEKITQHIANYLNKSGIIIPKDISIISLVDKSFSLFDYHNFTSILIPYYEFGQFLCRNLISICEKQAPTNTEFSSSFDIIDKNTVANLSSRAKSHIIVIGSVNIDFTMNVNTFPQPGKAVTTKLGSINVGGKGANQAVGVAKLNASSYVIGKVGNDYYSSLVFSCMNENNVNSCGLYKDEMQETGKAYIHLLSTGESSITIFLGANSTLTPEEIDKQENHFKNADYCLLSTEISIELILEALKLAKKHNVKTILKPAACEEINETILQYVDIFIPNQNEAELLSKVPKSSLESQAKYFTSLGAKTVIITLAQDGAYVYSNDFVEKLPAITTVKVEDTTGGADAFISALAVYLDLGYSLKKATQIALYAASFCISKPGVIPSLVDKNTLETYILKNEPALLNK